MSIRLAYNDYNQFIADLETELAEHFGSSRAEEMVVRLSFAEFKTRWLNSTADERDEWMRMLKSGYQQEAARILSEVPNSIANEKTAKKDAA